MAYVRMPVRGVRSTAPLGSSTMRGLIVNASVGRLGPAGATTCPNPTAAEGACSSRAWPSACAARTGTSSAGQLRRRRRPARRDLVLGHESLGRVISDDAGVFAPATWSPGSCVGPTRCRVPNCAVGEWDMCRNGRYVECGIKQRHGFARQRWRIEPDFAVRVDPALADCGVLLEPTSVRRQGVGPHRTHRRAGAVGAGRRVLVTGAGPVGLLAALLGVQRGLDTHVFDRVAERRRSPTWYAGWAPPTTPARCATPACRPDVVLECTGADCRDRRRARHRRRRTARCA